MSWLRWPLIACLVFGLAGCGVGKKDTRNTSRPGSGGSSDEESNPTYEWIRPAEDLQPQEPPKQPGERDPF